MIYLIIQVSLPRFKTVSLHHRPSSILAQNLRGNNPFLEPFLWKVS